MLLNFCFQLIAPSLTLLRDKARGQSNDCPFTGYSPLCVHKLQIKDFYIHQEIGFAPVEDCRLKYGPACPQLAACIFCEQKTVEAFRVDVLNASLCHMSCLPR